MFNALKNQTTNQVLYLEVLKNTGDITLNKIGRLEAEKGREKSHRADQY